MTDSSIVVSGDDLRQLKKSSIAVPGTRDSYWVDLSVTHELHCIVRAPPEHAIF